MSTTNTEEMRQYFEPDGELTRLREAVSQLESKLEQMSADQQLLKAREAMCMRILERDAEAGPNSTARNEQAARVMPLIGAMLDAWDQLPADIASMPELDHLGRHIERINAAMEGRPNDKVMREGASEK